MTTARPAATTLDQVVAAVHRDAPSLWDAYHPERPRLARLHLILYFAQGHHLAHTGQALFPDPIIRTATGIHIDLPTEVGVHLPNNGAWCTIGAALSRYRNLVMPDLRALLHASEPWQNTPAGEPISTTALRAWFTRPEETDDPDDERPSTATVTTWLNRKNGQTP